MEILFRLNALRCGERFSSCWRRNSDREKSFSSDDERVSEDDEESDKSFSSLFGLIEQRGPGTRRGIGLLAQWDSKSPFVRIRRVYEGFRSLLSKIWFWSVNEPLLCE